MYHKFNLIRVRGQQGEIPSKMVYGASIGFCDHRVIIVWNAGRKCFIVRHQYRYVEPMEDPYPWAPAKFVGSARDLGSAHKLAEVFMMGLSFQ